MRDLLMAAMDQGAAVDDAMARASGETIATAAELRLRAGAQRTLAAEHRELAALGPRAQRP